MDFASAYQSQNNSRQFGSIQVIFKYHSWVLILAASYSDENGILNLKIIQTQNLSRRLKSTERILNLAKLMYNHIVVRKNVIKHTVSEYIFREVFRIFSNI